MIHRDDEGSGEGWNVICRFRPPILQMLRRLAIPARRLQHDVALPEATLTRNEETGCIAPLSRFNQGTLTPEYLRLRVGAALLEATLTV